MYFVSKGKVIIYVIALFCIFTTLHTANASFIEKDFIMKEDFERGSYTGTKFTAGSGKITNDADKVVNGKYSAYLSSPPTTEWSEFSYTDPNQVRFEKNTTYEVTFSYRAVEAPDENKNGSYYFLARGTDYDVSADTGWKVWNAKTGEKGTKTFVFTTGNKDNYYLIWGIRWGGSLSIDDIYIRKKAESFERGTFDGTRYLSGSGTITSDPDKVISGAYSAYLAAPHKTDWMEFSYSSPSSIRFDRNTTYSVTFSYKTIEPSNGFFYFLARSTDYDVAEDIGWTAWNGQKGETNHKTVVFTTGEKENYYLIWGIREGGAISIDDIRIDILPYQYDPNGRLKAQATPIHMIHYDYDANGNILRRRAEINYHI